MKISLELHAMTADNMDYEIHFKNVRKHIMCYCSRRSQKVDGNKYSHKSTFFELRTKLLVLYFSNIMLTKYS